MGHQVSLLDLVPSHVAQARGRGQSEPLLPIPEVLKLEGATPWPAVVNRLGPAVSRRPDPIEVTGEDALTEAASATTRSGGVEAAIGRSGRDPSPVRSCAVLFGDRLPRTGRGSGNKGQDDGGYGLYEPQA